MTKKIKIEVYSEDLENVIIKRINGRGFLSSLNISYSFKDIESSNILILDYDEPTEEKIYKAFRKFILEIKKHTKVFEIII